MGFVVGVQLLVSRVPVYCLALEGLGPFLKVLVDEKVDLLLSDLLEPVLPL